MYRYLLYYYYYYNNNYYYCSTTKTVLGTRHFAVAGPLVRNSLPANIRSASVSLQTSADN